MRIQELCPGKTFEPQKWPAHEVPHLVIETNKTCNIQCAHCYSANRQHVKSYDEVLDEIDLGMRRRKLESISLLGGEPTMHPRIVDIVSAIKRRGLTCLLLTNGLTFLRDTHDVLLKQLKAAGLDRVMVHIDDGQKHVHEDIEGARRAVFDKLEQYGVMFGISATVCTGDEERFPRLLIDYTGYRYFDGILATLALDFDAFPYAGDPEAEPSMLHVCQEVSRQIGATPTTYIPTNLDDQTVGWIMYMYYVNRRTGQVFSVSPTVAGQLRKLIRKLSGRHGFATTTPLTLTPVFALLTAAWELAVDRGRKGELLRFFGTMRHRDDLRYQYIILQRAPRFNEEHGEVKFCYHCPDATVRHGRLTPVCVADRLSPIGEAPTVDAKVAEAMWRHLREDAQPLCRPDSAMANRSG